MIRRPPRSTRTDTLLPYTTLFRSDRLGERAGVSDAGRAAIADEIIADRIEMRLQPRLFEIVGDDLRPRSQAGLDPWLGFHAAFVRFFRDQSRGDHDAGVRRVGATGDRGDDDVAVADVMIRSDTRRVGEECGSTCRSRWSP